MLARLSIGVLSLLSRCAVRRAIAPTAPGCGTVGWVLDAECGTKGLLAGELNGMRTHPPSRSTPRRAPTFNAGTYYPPNTQSGAKWMGGYGFPGDHAGFGSNRARPEDADRILAYSESLQKLHTICSGPRTSAARRCAAEDVDHLGFLLQLCELELIERERRAAQRRLKAARFQHAGDPTIVDPIAST
jgi:hypothetical protein